MPSSISSSSPVVPHADYRRLWLWSFLTFVVLLVGAEAHWRSNGHLKSVTDSRQLWSAWREHVVDATSNRRSLAIIGDSRMQLGIVPEVLRRELPMEPTMLGVQGTHAFRTLADLCTDPDFRGVILCGSMEQMFLPDNLDRQRAYVEFYHDFWSRPFAALDQRVNTVIKSWLQQHLVTLSPNLIFKRQVTGRFLTPPAYIETRPDRSRGAHYRTILGTQKVAQLRRENLTRVGSIAPDSPERREQFAQVLVKQVAPLVARLKARGGEVMFLRMPVAAEMWKLDARQSPREHYWDRVGPLTGARTLHFRDSPELNGFECPDASHLDVTEAREFTTNLAKVLRALPANAQ